MIPECLVQFANHLTEMWDEFDKRHAAVVQKALDEYRAWDKQNPHAGFTVRMLKRKELGCSENDVQYYLRTPADEQHRRNEKDAQRIVENLVARVEKKVGEVTSWERLFVTLGNLQEGKVINGYVTGTKGECRVESVGAGGYNIQRYHIRTLVK